MSESEDVTRRSFLRSAGVVTAGFGLGSAVGGTPAVAAARMRTGNARRSWARITRRLDHAIPKAMLGAGIPGAIVGLWTPRGSYVRTFGVSNRQTGAGMGTDLHMRIGSETKTFTASAILQLVDQGKIRLSDPISKYIPAVPDGDVITIHDLGRMQSGLYPYTASDKFAKDYSSKPERSFTPEQLLRYSFSQPLLFAPGTKYVYDNTNYVLLGLVVEKLSGQPLGTYFRDHIFRRFGLRSTFLPTGTEFPSPHAHGYTINSLTSFVVDSTRWNPSWAWAAGGVISKLRDLRRWAPIVATGAGLLKPRTQRERLQTVHIPGPHRDVRYGFGIFTSGGWIGHNGSLPGYESVTVYLPAQDSTMVLLINTDILVGERGQEPSTLLGEAVTEIVTPGRTYGK
jgi:D-alanyl-D-alanine carboxypeptidase